MQVDDDSDTVPDPKTLTLAVALVVAHTLGDDDAAVDPEPLTLVERAAVIVTDAHALGGAVAHAEIDTDAEGVVELHSEALSEPPSELPADALVRGLGDTHAVAVTD